MDDLFLSVLEMTYCIFVNQWKDRRLFKHTRYVQASTPIDIPYAYEALRETRLGYL